MLVQGRGANASKQGRTERTSDPRLQPLGCAGVPILGSHCHLEFPFLTSKTPRCTPISPVREIVKRFSSRALAATGQSKTRAENQQQNTDTFHDYLHEVKARVELRDWGRCVDALA